MSKIAEILSPEQREVLATLKVLNALPPEPVDLPPVTTINGVDVDLRSEGRFQTTCADCQTPLEVEVAPEGVDLEMLTSRPRVAVCLLCGDKRLQGKQGVVIYTKPETKEEIELDLTKFSKAQLAALAVEARERMLAQKAEALPAEREAALKVEADREARDAALKAQDRAKYGKRKVWMGEFLVKGVTVPALDFTEVGLDEEVPPKVRSPYNKVLHAIGEPILEREGTTYRTLRKAHKRLWKQASVAAEMPKGKVAKIEPETERLLAPIEPEAMAKVKAFAEVTGLSLDQARERLASLSLV